MLAEALPLRVAGDADENLLAVGGGERLVDRPGAFARRHRRRRAAGDRLAGHVLRHQEGGRFEQRGFDELAAPGVLALAQRRLDGDHRERAAHDVDDGGAGAQRLAGRPGHVGKPGHELHHLVECRAMLVGAAEKTLERAIDEPRVGLGEIGIAAAEPVHGAGRVVFDRHVGGRRQAVQQRAAFVGLEIDGEAALVAVEGAEETGGEAGQPPGRIAADRLDLDHVGAEIGEDQPRARPHDGVAEFEHADAGKGERVGRTRSMRRSSLVTMPVAMYAGRCHGAHSSCRVQS